jgi:Zn-dependent M28 family amino/carboxypeptidase
MVNLDMVGHLRAEEFKVSIPNGISMQPIIEKLFDKYSFAKRITGRGTGGSDHASFYNKKIPVAFIHTGTHKYYHTPEDDIVTLNVPGIVEISKYAFELSWLLANEGRPEFDENSFKEMPYTHDHGETRF